MTDLNETGNGVLKSIEKTKIEDTTTTIKKSKKDAESIQSISDNIKEEIIKLEKVTGRRCYIFITDNSIEDNLVDDVFEDLRNNYKNCEGKLDVIVHSGGGSIDPAFSLAKLFRRFGAVELRFIVPRWAKSAATLLVCAGDKILMSPIAELGPLDPQITEMNPIEHRIENFSPLHIKSTLDLIRDEFKSGNEKLAINLIQRLQFPLTLGSYLKSMDLCIGYLTSLLNSRMLKGLGKEDVKKIAEIITKEYPDHSYCIDLEEAKGKLKLNIDELKGEELNITWNIYKLHMRKKELEQNRKRKEIDNIIKDLPKELVDKLKPNNKLELGGSDEQ